jgi:hypothetical protein
MSGRRFDLYWQLYKTRQVDMTVFDFRTTKEFRRAIAASEFGADYIEFDELLASGAEVALEDDAGGLLVLGESGEFE